MSNFRRWLDKDLIPPARLQDTARGYMVYSKHELEIVAELLAAHEQEFSYYCVQHTELREAIFNRLLTFREDNI